MAFNSNPGNSPETSLDVGNGLIMPIFTCFSNAIDMKNNRFNVRSSVDSLFWTEGIDRSHTEQAYESVKLISTPDATLQTIVDVSGSGVLTQVLTPPIQFAGTITIFVTIDGKETKFVSPTLSASPSNIRMMLGDFRKWEPTATTTDGAGIGSAYDSGYSQHTNCQYQMMTPMDAVVQRIGMKFETSLKVAVQGSVDFSTGGQNSNCAACYTTYIPEGL